MTKLPKLTSKLGKGRILQKLRKHDRAENKSIWFKWVSGKTDGRKAEPTSNLKGSTIDVALQGGGVRGKLPEAPKGVKHPETCFASVPAINKANQSK